MAEAKQFDAWNHTAAIRYDAWKIALAKKGTGLKVRHFHPLLKKQEKKQEKRKLSREESHALLTEFVNDHHGN